VAFKKPVKKKEKFYLRFDGMQETVNKAARNYKSTMSVFELDFLLANAIKISTDKPQSKRQEKFIEMLIMNVNTPVFLPYFGRVKMLVGVTKQKKNAKKIQYSITAIEPQ
jgi:predicted AAA+ superfamily ATPase